MSADAPVRHYRTVFISDIHLGTRGCQAELLLDFFRHVECETLYLVGDIVDGWKLKKWLVVAPAAQLTCCNEDALRMARKGASVIYIPGNHDDRARDYCGVHLGGVVVTRDADPRNRRRQTLSGPARRRVRRRHPPRPLARLPGRLGL